MGADVVTGYRGGFIITFLGIIWVNIESYDIEL
jgi:hypothetical protein